MIFPDIVYKILTIITSRWLRVEILLIKTTPTRKIFGLNSVSFHGYAILIKRMIFKRK